MNKKMLITGLSLICFGLIVVTIMIFAYNDTVVEYGEGFYRIGNVMFFSSIIFGCVILIKGKKV